MAVHNTKLVRRWLLAVPGRVLLSGRRVVLGLTHGMPWAATFTAVYQRLRLLTSSADGARHRDHSTAHGVP